MKIKHYDLFAGIGGFSLALERVFSDATIEHIFCEWEAFPTAVLKKHWPDGTFFGDIKDVVTHTESQRMERERGQEPKLEDDERRSWERDWREVALATCNDGMDDELSRIVDGVPYSRAKWRKESLKAYGNAIVPAVAVEIFKGIRLACLPK